MKAVAVPYVIAIIFGIVVTGVAVYWFLGTTGTGSGVSLSIECDGKRLSFCQSGGILIGWDSRCGAQPTPQECLKIAGTSVGVSQQPQFQINLNNRPGGLDNANVEEEY